MKKLLTGLSLIALLAGCASRDNMRDNNNGMGGTSDQYNNNATHATGTDAAPNDANKDVTGKDNTGQPLAPNPTQ